MTTQTPTPPAIPTRPIAVIGATGKTGRRVLDRLGTKGIATRALSRRSATPFDWDRPQGWADALAGSRAAYVSFVPDLALPGSVAAITTLTELAARLRLERLVLLSGRGEEEAQRCEEVVAAGDIPWTVVRSAWFNQNFSEGEFHGPLIDGLLALPATDVPEPFIDLDDVADVAVHGLTLSDDTSEVIDVTGPRLLTFADAVAEIGAAAGRELGFVSVAPDEFRSAAMAQGAPDEVLDLLGYLFGTVLDGRNAAVTDGVEKTLGRPARDFAEYARDAAALGVWSRG